MEPRAHHVFIGLFVVLLGAIGIGFALGSATHVPTTITSITGLCSMSQ